MKPRNLALAFIASLLPFSAPLGAQEAVIKDPAISGGVADGKVKLTIEGSLAHRAGEKDRVIFSTAVQHSVQVAREKITHSLALTLDILEGEPKELVLAIRVDAEIRSVTGEALLDWSEIGRAHV